ncbi:MAG: AI-2E family transporter [Candidatus Komeilibacteria bacterium]|jgi:predicted PurR-regulated permease PerM|nr:AI-2E family transporter [Candidatus Komeilibacteria bacterium]MBT4447288.1 AI-2E family transporter [Candidatus Komeilibacteria bacterium]
MSKQFISITTGTILRTILVLLFLGFLFLIKEVLALLFVAVILSSAFDPLIDWLQRFKIPRALSIIGVYTVVLSFVGWAIYLLSGPLTEQVLEMSKAFPDFYNKINQNLGQAIDLNNLFSQEALSASFTDITKSVGQATTGIFNVLSSVFGGMISFFMVLVITFYLTVEENAIKHFISSITPAKHKTHVSKLITTMQHRMGYWLRGQLLLSLIVFIMVYIGLLALGIKYALILALIAGIFEIVPFIGPWIAAIPGVFFAFSHSPSKALMVAIMYFVVQQLENNLMVPKIMGKSTGLNPLVVLIAIMTGARLGGIVGALLAVPVALAIAVYVESLMDNKKKK